MKHDSTDRLTIKVSMTNHTMHMQLNHNRALNIYIRGCQQTHSGEDVDAYWKKIWILGTIYSGVFKWNVDLTATMIAKGYQDMNGCGARKEYGIRENQWSLAHLPYQSESASPAEWCEYCAVGKRFNVKISKATKGFCIVICIFFFKWQF